MKLSDIKVLPRFRDKIPPQTEEQFKQLEENILTEGRVREPLTLWKDHGVLVDGHHRYRVLVEHPEISFSIDEIEFADEDAVDEWIIKNQLGKHNLTEIQMTMLRGLLYKARKNAVGNQGERSSDGKFQGSQNANKGKRTAAIVGEELGVDRATVLRSENVVDGIERAAAVDPGFKVEVLSGKVSAKKQDLAAIRKMDSDEEVKAAIEEIRNPTVSSVTSRTSGSKDQRIFNEKLKAISEAMEKPKGGYTLDDALRDLNSAEDMFIDQIEFILRARKTVIEEDERSHEALIGFIESVVADLNEMKGRF